MSKILCITCINNLESHLIIHRWSRGKCSQCHKKGQNLLVSFTQPNDVGENCFWRGGHGCGNIRTDIPWKPPNPPETLRRKQNGRSY